MTNISSMRQALEKQNANKTDLFINNFKELKSIFREYNQEILPAVWERQKASIGVSIFIEDFDNNPLKAFHHLFTSNGDENRERYKDYADIMCLEWLLINHLDFVEQHIDELVDYINVLDIIRLLNDKLKPVMENILKKSFKTNLDTYESAACKEDLLAFHYAAFRGEIFILEYFLDNGADINIEDEQGRTAIFHAIFSQDVEVVRYLVDHGANLSFKDKYADGESLQHLAAAEGNLNILQYLIEEKGSDINALNDKKETLLHAASIFAPKSTVRYLVEKGLDILAENSDGETPLHTMANGNCWEGFNYLIFELMRDRGRMKKPKVQNKIMNILRTMF